MHLAPLTLVLTIAADPSGAISQGAPAAWFDVRSFGAKGDGKTDDSAAIQAALDAARSAGGGVVFVPAGTYVVAPPRTSSGTRLESLTIGSNTWLRGDGPATVLKVKSGIGNYRSLFSNHPTASSYVENVVLSDLRFDQNCSASGGEVRSGGDGRSGFFIYLAWGGRNLTVERVRFDPICGVNTVVLNAPAAENLVVRDCYFRFVKGPTRNARGFYDNTAVYVHGRGAAVTGNLFESTAADGAGGAIELHGSRALAATNVTRWYQSCVRVVGTSEWAERPPSGENGFTVVGNTCSDAKDAINLWSITKHGLRGVTVVGNTIGLAEIDHLARAEHGHFSGISFVWDAVSGRLDGDISDVVIEGNVITAQPADGLWRKIGESSGGITILSTGNVSNVLVRGNVVRDIPTKGIHVQSMGRGTKVKNVRVEGNVVMDAGNDPSAGLHRAGIVLGGRLEDVEVADNSIMGARIPFRGRYAIRAATGPGSLRVGIRDNVWSVADQDRAYELGIEGPGIDAGVDGRTKASAVSPGAGDVLSVDGSGTRSWDLTITGGNAFCIRAPRNVVPGQRLTIRVRNAHGGPLGPIRWDGFKIGPWTSPAPRHNRVLEVVWDGTAWCEVFHSSSDIPN